MEKSSVEQLKARGKASRDEKVELDKRVNSLRTKFDMERKSRQEAETKNHEFESEECVGCDQSGGVWGLCVWRGIMGGGVVGGTAPYTGPMVDSCGILVVKLVSAICY